MCTFARPYGRAGRCGFGGRGVTKAEDYFAGHRIESKLSSSRGSRGLVGNPIYLPEDFSLCIYNPPETQITAHLAQQQQTLTAPFFHLQQSSRAHARCIHRGLRVPRCGPPTSCAQPRPAHSPWLVWLPRLELARSRPQVTTPS
jgi:hypothetical protein